jgi:hypothetical protein
VSYSAGRAHRREPTGAGWPFSDRGCGGGVLPGGGPVPEQVQSASATVVGGGGTVAVEHWEPRGVSACGLPPVPTNPATPMIAAAATMVSPRMTIKAYSEETV